MCVWVGVSGCICVWVGGCKWMYLYVCVGGCEWMYLYLGGCGYAHTVSTNLCGILFSQISQMRLHLQKFIRKYLIRCMHSLLIYFVCLRT